MTIPDQFIAEAASDHEISLYCDTATIVGCPDGKTYRLDEHDILSFLRHRWGDRLRLELGSGRVGEQPPWGKLQWATLDINESAGPNADLYKDLEAPWYAYGVDEIDRKNGLIIPLPDSCIAEIHANQVLEHIRNIIPLMNDCYRVLVPGGFMKASVPHHLSPFAWGDPTHVRAFSETSFMYYCRREDGTQFTYEFCDYGITAMFDQEDLQSNPKSGITVILRKPEE